MFSQEFEITYLLMLLLNILPNINDVEDWVWTLKTRNFYI